MKLALLSDIHANIQALDTCLQHALDNGTEQFVLLGDFVGYGANPVEVVRRVQTLAADGALLIKGNHDAGAVSPPVFARTVGDSTTAWTHAQLSIDQRQFLHQLPMVMQHGSILLLHASADGPDLWRYVYTGTAAAASLGAAATLPDVRHVFGGHVHHQTLYVGRGIGTGVGRGDQEVSKLSPLPGVSVALPMDRHWLATIGSAGQPRDGDPRAMYATFDTETLAFTFHRVAYDHHAAAEAIVQAGLPAWLAARLALGR
jgi:diadenosine tetraphosphatase ApaH/serine/threonine PP2A family protein phosphatase